MALLGRAPWLRNRSSAPAAATSSGSAPPPCGSSRTAAPPVTGSASARSPSRPGPRARRSTGMPGTTRALAMTPPGAPHPFATPGDEPLVMVNTFTPDLYVQYFRDLRQLVAAGEAPTPEATARVMSRYATEVTDDYAAE